MMKIYAVEAIVEEEYGGAEVVKVFAHRADAEGYVEEHQEMLDVWFSDDSIPMYSIREFEVC